MPGLDRVYLSPHFDDAALSCGGAIHARAAAGDRVLVITVCAAGPADRARLSPLARRYHAHWRDPDDVAETRRGEDDAALAILGARALRMDVADCIYRAGPGGDWLYPTQAAVFGPPHPADRALVADIVDTVTAAAPDAAVYAPLAVGGHADHRLCHRAGLELAARGHAVELYEDYPYVDAVSPMAAGPGVDLAARLAGVAAHRLEPRLHSIDDDDLRAKIAAIEAYDSQLAMLFGPRARVGDIVERYAASIEPGQRVERGFRLV